MPGVSYTPRQMCLFVFMYSVLARMMCADGAPVTNSVNYTCLLCPLRQGKQTKDNSGSSKALAHNDNVHYNIDIYSKTKREPETADIMGRLSGVQQRQLRDIEGLDMQSERTGDVLNKLFDVYDLNNDNFISREEFSTVFRLLH